MTDHPMVSGLHSAADRYGQPAPQQQPRQPRQHGAAAAPGGDDHVELSAAGDVAFALLRERVLAATRETVPGAGSRFERFFRDAVPRRAAAVVARIQTDQRWLCGNHPPDERRLLAAFARGLDETRAILAVVAGADAELERWCAAIAQHLGDLDCE